MSGANSIERIARVVPIEDLPDDVVSAFMKRLKEELKTCFKVELDFTKKNEALYMSLADADYYFVKIYSKYGRNMQAYHEYRKKYINSKKLMSEEEFFNRQECPRSDYEYCSIRVHKGVSYASEISEDSYIAAGKIVKTLYLVNEELPYFLHCCMSAIIRYAKREYNEKNPGYLTLPPLLSEILREAKAHEEDCLVIERFEEENNISYDD